MQFPDSILVLDRGQVGFHISTMADHFLKDPPHNPVFLIVLRGGAFFGHDFLRYLPYDYEYSIDYCLMESYGHSKAPEGPPRFIFHPTLDVADRTVVILEDIVDTGRTVTKLCEFLYTGGAAAVQLYTLCYKKMPLSPLPTKFGYVAKPDEFLFGYGMDLEGKYRALTGIYAVDKGDSDGVVQPEEDRDSSGDRS